MECPKHRVLSLGSLFALMIAGCVGERIVTTEMQQQAGLIVRANLESRLAAAGQALNWAPCVVPGAVVIVQRVPDAGSDQTSSDTVIADSAGIARLSDRPFAQYTIRVTRELTQAEQTRAKSALGGVYALEALRTTAIDVSSGASVDLEVRGVERGTLVISEIYPTAVALAPGQYWYWASYVEIYNNSDAAITLAGKLFFDAFYSGSDSPLNPCSRFAAFKADPAGLWAQLIYRFPDNAEPVQPGESVVVATDAIDHRQFGNGIGFPDLSHAQYEFRGSADVDNPTAKDMIDVGPRVIPFGHGWFGAANRKVVALASPLDIGTLPTMLNPDLVFPYALIPKAALIDVFQYNTTYQGTYPPCPSSVDPDIDAGEPRLIYPEDTISMHRKVRFTLPDGRPVLQKSRNSAADWFAAPGTPGKVP
jgi:hypothetical protein